MIYMRISIQQQNTYAHGSGFVVIFVVNSFPPSVAYMRQWIGSALIQIMACRLLGAKPLSKPELVSCQLDPWEQTSVKF